MNDFWSKYTGLKSGPHVKLRTAEEIEREKKDATLEQMLGVVKRIEQKVHEKSNLNFDSMSKAFEELISRDAIGKAILEARVPVARKGAPKCEICGCIWRAIGGGCLQCHMDRKKERSRVNLPPIPNQIRSHINDASFGKIYSVVTHPMPYRNWFEIYDGPTGNIIHQDMSHWCEDFFPKDTTWIKPKIGMWVKTRINRKDTTSRIIEIQIKDEGRYADFGVKYWQGDNLSEGKNREECWYSRFDEKTWLLEVWPSRLRHET